MAVSLIRKALALEETQDGEPESPWLFPAQRDGSDGSIEGHAATVALLRGRQNLGMAHFRIHDLRRTAATRLAEMGINPYTISLVLNHVSASKSTITGKFYVQYSFDREEREALDAWSVRLEQIIAGKDDRAEIEKDVLCRAYAFCSRGPSAPSTTICPLVRAAGFVRELSQALAAPHDDGRRRTMMGCASQTTWTFFGAHLIWRRSRATRSVDRREAALSAT